MEKKGYFTGFDRISRLSSAFKGGFGVHQQVPPRRKGLFKNGWPRQEPELRLGLHDPSRLVRLAGHSAIGMGDSYDILHAL